MPSMVDPPMGEEAVVAGWPPCNPSKPVVEPIRSQTQPHVSLSIHPQIPPINVAAQSQ